MFLTSNTQTRRQERINYPADSGNKAQVCLSKNLLRTWVQSQHSGVRHKRTAQCSTVSEKQEPEDIAYSVGTALGLIPSTNIYKYLCVCIHLYLYIPTLTTPYQHCPHLSMPGHTYRSHLGLVLTLYPVEAESHQLPLIRTSYTRVAGLQAILSQPPTSPYGCYDHRCRAQHAAFKVNWTQGCQLCMASTSTTQRSATSLALIYRTMNFQWLWTRDGWTGQIKVDSKDCPKATCFMNDDTADITYKIEGGNF